MVFFATLRELDGPQRKVVLASFLGWTLDAFDYFLLVFVIPEVARDFHVGVTEVAFSLTLTLAMRPLGRSTCSGGSPIVTDGARY